MVTGTVQELAPEEPKPPSRTIQYDPQWWTIALVVCLAAVAAVLPLLLSVPVRFARVAAVLLVGVAALLVFRRLVFPRVVILTDRGVSFPTGFLRLRVHQISFAEIVRLQEVALPFMLTLQIQTPKRNFELVSSLLTPGSYEEIRETIATHISRTH